MQEKDKYLGEFEHLLLLAVIKLQQEAYGTQLRELLAETISRDVTIGALYTTLERMENKGLVKSWLGEATSQRGGRAKKFYQVTSLGKQALQRAKTALDIMWRDVSLSQTIQG